MKIDAGMLDRVFTGFKALFNDGFAGAPAQWREVAMETKSATAKEIYGWLGEMPAIREWVGDRVVHQLGTHGFTLENKKFENTVSVKRETIEDDTVGLMAPLFRHLGRQTALFPDELVFGLLAEGYRMMCYDGQNFFDKDHPVVRPNGSVEMVSNYETGAGPAWFLLDTSQVVKPLIWQERLPFEFQSLTSPNDEHVMFKDEYVYGVRGRGAAGLGLWQTAFMSRQPLTEFNYEAARNAMSRIRADRNGRALGIVPNALVVPPALEGHARRILQRQVVEASDNIWAGSAELIVSHYVA